MRLSLWRRAALLGISAIGLPGLVGCGGGGGNTPSVADGRVILSRQFNVANFGLARYNASNAEVIKETSVAGAGSGSNLTLTSDGSLLYTTGNTVRKYTKTDIGGNSVAFSPALEPIQDIIELPSKNILAVRNGGYTVFNGSNGTLVREVDWSSRRNFNDVKVAPNGTLYTTSSANSIRRITRYIINAGDVLSEDRILVEGSNSLFYEMVFMSNGDLLVSDSQNELVRRYDINGTPLGGNLSINNASGAMALGRSIITSNDEVLFINTINGIKRARYTNGTFTLLDQNPFLPFGTLGAFDLLIMPAP